MKRAMSKLWLLDLDDTLFEASAGMLYSIHLRMNEYIVKHLGVTDDEASDLRTRYWATYGATFLGLWRHHGIEPTQFLSFAHDFDLAPFVRHDQHPACVLRQLSGKKVVFTNGPRNYAERILRCLKLNSVIDGMVTSTDMKALGEWRPKPSRLMLVQTCRRFGVAPCHATLVDDSVMNLKCAYEVGLRTVWCTGYRQRHGKLANRYALPFIDHSITHIRELPFLKR